MITAKLPSEGLHSWAPENCSMVPREDRGPNLINPALNCKSENFKKST